MNLTKVLQAGNVDQDEGYRACAVITKNASTNFYNSFRILSPEKRRSIYVIYAFCRICDDAADSGLDTERSTDILDKIEADLRDAYSGNPTNGIWKALEHTSHRFNIPLEPLEEIIKGCRMDTIHSRYELFEDLLVYCRRVAGAVGLVCTEVFGYEDPQALQYASTLGVGMQLTNIARDMGEDASLGRIYIPLKELEEFKCSEEDILDKKATRNTRELTCFQVRRAYETLQRGSQLMPLLDARPRLCPEAMVQTYKALLKQIEKTGFDSLTKKVELTRVSKTMLAVQFLIKGYLVMLRNRNE